jgi:hypothetical protein
MGRPAAVPPSCFSQLYSLNQCYEDILMMKQILSKVICDMAATDPDFQKCLAQAMAAAGSNVPLVGVTDGSNAQPGQVGEFLSNRQTVNIPAVTGTNNQFLSTIVLPPGDWDIWAWTSVNGIIDALLFSLDPQPAGFSNSAAAWFDDPTNNGVGLTISGMTARGSVSVPTLLVFIYSTVCTTATTAAFQVEARRRR